MVIFTIFYNIIYSCGGSKILNLNWVRIYGNGYIERKINASGYKGLSIQYALRNSESRRLESNDYCGLYFIQNGFKTYIHQWNWNDIDNLDGLIQLIYLPKLFENADNICIGFDNNGTNGWYDRCYVTVTIFQGISITPDISTTNELDNNSDNKEVNIKKSTKTSTLIITIIVSIIIVGCCLLCIFIVKGCGSIKENLKGMMNISVKTSSPKSEITNPSMYDGVYSKSFVNTKGQQSKITQNNIQMIPSTPTPHTMETPKDLMDLETNNTNAENNEGNDDTITSIHGESNANNEGVNDNLT